MNELVSQRGTNLADEMDENDPLLELARIVSGEDLEQPPTSTESTSASLEVIENNLTDEERSALTEEELSPQLLAPMDLEAELMAGLDLGPDLDLDSEVEPEASLEEPVLVEPQMPEEIAPEAAPEQKAAFEQIDETSLNAHLAELMPDAGVVENNDATQVEINLEDQLMQELAFGYEKPNTSEVEALITEDTFEAILPNVEETPEANPFAEQPEIVTQEPIQDFLDTTFISEPVAEPEPQTATLESEDISLDDQLAAAIETEFDLGDTHSASTVAEITSAETEAEIVDASVPDTAETFIPAEELQDDPFAQVESLAAEVASEIAIEDAMEAELREPEVIDPATTELPTDKPFENEDLGQAFMAEFEQLESTSASTPVQDADILMEDEFLKSLEADLTNNNTTPESDKTEDLISELGAELGIAAAVTTAATAAVASNSVQKAVPSDLEKEMEAVLASETHQPQPMPMPTDDFTQGSTEATEDFLTDPVLLDAQAYPVEPEQKGSGFKLAAIAIGVALVAGVSAVGYGYVTNGSVSGPPPTIAADKTPVKQKPVETAAAKNKPAEKAAYVKVEGQAESQTQKKLVSGTEKVKKIATSKTEERLTPSSGDQATTQPKAVKLRKVRTVTVKPDGTIVKSAELKVVAKAKKVVADPVKATKEVAKVVPAAVSTDAGSIDGAKKTGALVIPSNSPLPKPELRSTNEVALVTPKAAKPVVVKPAVVKPVVKAQPKPAPAQKVAAKPVQVAAVKPAAPGGWAVQISSQRSNAAAQSSLRNLKRRFPMLNGQSIGIQKADVTGKGTFYRVRVSAGSKQNASRFCSRLKAAGGSCFISR